MDGDPSAKDRSAKFSLIWMERYTCKCGCKEAIVVERENRVFIMCDSCYLTRDPPASLKSKLLRIASKL